MDDYNNKCNSEMQMFKDATSVAYTSFCAAWLDSNITKEDKILNLFFISRPSRICDAQFCREYFYTAALDIVTEASKLAHVVDLIFYNILK
jgi:hypothetical protein